MTVMGLDLSLTSTGIAVIDGATITLAKVASKGKDVDDLVTRSRRLNAIGAAILDLVQIHSPELIVIEGPSMSSKFGHAHDRSGLWWLIVMRLMRSVVVVEVPPSNRMKYATGKGQASKDVVLTAVVRRYQHQIVQPIESNDTADALILAAMGQRFLGAAIETSLPATHLAAMDKVHWIS